MSHYKKLVVTQIIHETKDSKTFHLEAVNGELISYQPGQFLTFVFPKHDHEERRSYSISSTPILNEPLSITVKKVTNGEYSRKLVDHLKTGDFLQTIGPSGFFTLPADLTPFRQIFLIAAGSGIVPVFSLLKTILHVYPKIKVVLIYSNSSVKQTIFYEQLQQLEKSFPAQLTIEWLMSNNPQLERARLGKWLLEILLKKYSIAPYEEIMFYTCGPFDYMRMINIKLLAEGVPAQHIRKENFTIFKPTIKNIPPDIAAHQVIIHVNENTYKLSSEYPKTILQSARQKGIDLPYSCEAGKCGTCAALCTSGKVWMSYNEVLLDEEIAKGRVLTCVGYPVGGDVELWFSE